MLEETHDAEASSGIVCDSTSLVTSFRPRAAKLFGWKPEEVVGKQSVVIFHEPCAVAMLVRRLLRTAAEIGEFEEELTLVPRNESKFVGTLTVRSLLHRGVDVDCMGLTRHLRSI